jgi:hypothetical protein
VHGFDEELHGVAVWGEGGHGYSLVCFLLVVCENLIGAVRGTRPRGATVR